MKGLGKTFFYTVFTVSVLVFLSSCFLAPINNEPSPIYPKDGQEDVKLNVTLSWSVEGSADLTYDLYLSDSSELVESMEATVLIAEGLNKTEYTVKEPLKENTW
ncbi:MAG: hypothetical protein J7L34_02485, partial [Thermotogaceae bacterium]|nr:hypothetical protein [Thermotogaceae bacterium]